MRLSVFARVLENSPKLILANQPTRGLDVGAATFVHNQLLDARKNGSAVILISEDLEELMAISDQIAVMYHGQICAPIPVEEVTLRKLGLLMSGEGFVPMSEGQPHAA